MSDPTPDVATIAAALQTALQSIDGLRTAPYLADTISPPVALVAVDEVAYHCAFAGGDVVHTFTVFVIVGRSSDRAGLQLAEAYMSQAGNPQSISGAIEADRTLGGVVSTLKVTKSGPMSSLSINGQPTYISVPFAVEVHA
jgi:hypothetical protein